jgi:prepilin-type N-terminal cleavage/methylation domain-containing protein
MTRLPSLPRPWLTWPQTPGRRRTTRRLTRHARDQAVRLAVPSSSEAGFTFLEVIVVIVVVGALLGSLLGWLRQATVDTDRDIHYLRALELGQEMIDWVNASPLDAPGRQALLAAAGSLVDAQTGRSRPVPAAATREWPADPAELVYPAAYEACFYHRTLRIEPVAGRPALFEVTVEVAWNEGTPPAAIEAVGGPPDRMRKIVLSTLVYDGSPTR